MKIDRIYDTILMDNLHDLSAQKATSITQIWTNIYTNLMKINWVTSTMYQVCVSQGYGMMPEDIANNKTRVSLTALNATKCTDDHSWSWGCYMLKTLEYWKVPVTTKGCLVSQTQPREPKQYVQSLFIFNLVQYDVKMVSYVQTNASSNLNT